MRVTGEGKCLCNTHTPTHIPRVYTLHSLLHILIANSPGGTIKIVTVSHNIAFGVIIEHNNSIEKYNCTILELH